MESRILKGMFPKVPAPALGSKSIIVMPVNAQGILELTDIGRRFQYMFKETVKKYRADCYYNLLDPGDISIYEEDGFTICFVCYKQSEVGSRISKDSSGMQAVNLGLAVGKMLRTVESSYKDVDEIKFYSPTITFADVQHKILASKIPATWYCVVSEDK